MQVFEVAGAWLSARKEVGSLRCGDYIGIMGSKMETPIQYIGAM